MYFTAFSLFALPLINAPIFLAHLHKRMNRESTKKNYSLLSFLAIVMVVITFLVNYNSPINNLLYDGVIWIFAIIMTVGAEHLSDVI